MSWNKWDKSSIVAKLKEYHRAGVDLGVQKDLFQFDSSLKQAMPRHFGSYAAAMSAAGIAYEPCMPRYKDAKAVMRGIRRRRRQQKSLCYKNVQEEDSPLIRVAMLFFGSWGTAVEAAGFRYDRIRILQAWDRQRVIQRLRRMHARGANMSTVRMQSSPQTRRLYAAACNHFDSYQAAIQAAGIDYESIRCPAAPIWSRQRVLETIQRMHARGKDLSNVGTRKLGGFVQAGIRYFGSWRGAVEAAGFDYMKVRRCPPIWTPESVLQRLRDLRAKGEDLSPGRMQKNPPLLSVYQAAMRYHGSYRAALEKAGIEYASALRVTRFWTDALILERLTELDREGQDLRDRTMKVRYMPLYYAAKRYFGTYINAVAQAGIDYDRVVQQALRKVRRSGGGS